jgi:phage terminase large subunit
MKKEIPKKWVKKTNNTELSIYLKNGSVISLKGAENPDSLRGATLKGLCVDEIASIRNWEWLWSEVLAATLVRHNSPVIFISTPKGYNHFYDLYQNAVKNKELWKSWHFTSYDNPYLPKKVIDEKKKELTEDQFAQEYLADFKKYTGLVYKDFDREIHVIEPFDIPEKWRIYRGVDFGSTNPTAVLWIAVDDDGNFFIAEEYYQTKKAIDYHAGQINSNKLSSRVSATYGDPSGGQWFTEFAKRRINITPANKETGTALQNWVRFGIEKVAERLVPVPGHFVDKIGSGNGKLPKLFVFNTCENTIEEFENYRWKEKAPTQAQDLNEPDMPEKANDHAMDALRYFVVSYPGQRKYHVDNKKRIAKWEIK